MSRAAADALVLDASVLINFLPLQCNVKVLLGLSARFLVEERAYREVKKPISGKDESIPPLEPLVLAGAIQQVKMEDRDLGLYVELVGGRISIDDGEAASIAYAVGKGFGVVLDDRKARRLCAEEFSYLEVHSTVGLLRMAFEHNLIDLQTLGESLITARTVSRMRVLPEELDWVKQHAPKHSW